MRILVTGHKGYIGVVLTPMLAERGHEVVGLDTDLFSRCDFGGVPPTVPEILKDIRDVEEADLDGFDAVLHLAGLSNDPLGNYDARLTHEINCAATLRLAELAKARGVERFVFSSSCSNYGAAGEDWLTEEAEFNPFTPYGRSKAEAETGLAAMADDRFSPTHLRNATAFGHSCRIRFDLVLNNLVAWAMTTGRIYIKSDGTPWRSIVHIEDIARAFVASVEADRDLVHNEAFNVGRNEDNYRIRDIAAIVADVVPDCRIDYAPDGKPDPRSFRVDCSKILRVLSAFEPQWTTRTGTQQLYEVLRANELTLDEFEGPRYQRIGHIESLISQGLLTRNFRNIAP